MKATLPFGLAVFALLAGCTTTTQDLRIVSSTLPARAPVVQGAPLEASQIRFGAAAEWAAVPGSQEQGDPDTEGGHLVPAGLAQAWFGLGVSDVVEIFAAAGASFPGSQRSDRERLPFEPPSSLLFTADLGLRAMFPVPSGHVGPTIVARLNQVRATWDWYECRGVGADAFLCNDFQDVGEPRTEVFMTGGAHVGLAYHTPFSETVGLFFHLGVEFLQGFPAAQRDTAQGGERLPAPELETELYVLPTLVLGVEVMPVETLRLRWSVAPASAQPDGSVQFMVVQAAAEVVF